jgi:hypothetical protein
LIVHTHYPIARLEADTAADSQMFYPVLVLLMRAV